MQPVDAMVEAAAVLTPSSGDVNVAAAARAVAGRERSEALRDSALPDVASTVSVDEHTLGIQTGASDAAVSDAAQARAALLAAQAYPGPLRGAPGWKAPVGPTRSTAGHALYRRRAMIDAGDPVAI